MQQQPTQALEALAGGEAWAAFVLLAGAEEYVVSCCACSLHVTDSWLMCACALACT
jgi:hypothetical protein